MSSSGWFSLLRGVSDLLSLRPDISHIPFLLNVFFSRFLKFLSLGRFLPKFLQSAEKRSCYAGFLFKSDKIMNFVTNKKRYNFFLYFFRFSWHTHTQNEQFGELTDTHNSIDCGELKPCSRTRTFFASFFFSGDVIPSSKNFWVERLKSSEEILTSAKVVKF